jgi:hypothetical protein
MVLKPTAPGQGRSCSQIVEIPQTGTPMEVRKDWEEEKEDECWTDEYYLGCSCDE